MLDAKQLDIQAKAEQTVLDVKTMKAKEQEQDKKESAKKTVIFKKKSKK